MMSRIRRVTASAGVVALAMGATVALAAAPSGAASPHPAAASATVGINGMCGGVIPGVTPTNLRESHSDSNSLRVFREQLNYTLSGTAPVDFTAVGLYNGKAPN